MPYWAAAALLCANHTRPFLLYAKGVATPDSTHRSTPPPPNPAKNLEGDRYFTGIATGYLLQYTSK